MAWIDTPLTATTIFSSWCWDTSTVVLVAAFGLGYLRFFRKTGNVARGRAVCFLVMGLGIWLITGLSSIGVYSDTLFWVRALQVLLLLYVVPFGLAAGKPLTVLRDNLSPEGQARLDAVIAGPVARALTFPAVPSVAMLVTPWLLFLSPWYEAVLRHGVVDAVTRLLLVVIGFLYFYSRLQTDPVPHHYSQSISLLITVLESLGDGVLGIVLWLGPLVATGYYQSFSRTWGPNPRLDQTIGAGVFWILGDVLGIPFLFALMRAFTADERRKAALIDAELDAAAEKPPAAKTSAEPEEPPTTSGLWWENDPQLRDRFRR